jgi:hypothetical protein
VDSVRADHEVVLARRSVAELHRDRAVSLAELAHVDSHPDCHVASPVEQHRMEVGAMERQAGSDPLPQRGEIDLDQQPAAVVADALPRNHDPSLQDCLFETQRAERRRRVPGQVYARARLAPHGLALDDLGREASTRERSGGRETGDASPDDEDSCRGYYDLASRTRALFAARCPASRRSMPLSCAACLRRNGSSVDDIPCCATAGVKRGLLVPARSPIKAGAFHSAVGAGFTVRV